MYTYQNASLFVVISTPFYVLSNTCEQSHDQSILAGGLEYFDKRKVLSGILLVLPNSRSQARSDSEAGLVCYGDAIHDLPLVRKSPNLHKFIGTYILVVG